MKTVKYIIAAVAVLALSACSSDYLDTVPTSSTSTETIFESTQNAKLAINGLSKMMTVQYLSSQGFNGEGTIKTWYGNYPGNDYQKCALTGWANIINSTKYHETNTSAYDYYPWYYYYKLIGNANKVIMKIDNATGTDSERNFIKAQALTFRAYSFMQLAQLYSKRWCDSNNGATRGVALRLDDSTDSIPCSTLAETFKQIYDDLDLAISCFQASDEDRASDAGYAPNINVAYAVYARAALIREDWATAAKYAPLARNGYSLMSTSEYKDGGFSTPNSEWIWYVYSAEDETLYYYQYFSYEGSNASSSVSRNYPSAISKDLYVQIPETDIRRDMFLDPGDYTGYTASTGRDTKTLYTKAFANYGDKLYSTSRVYIYMQFKQQNIAQPGVGNIPLFRSSEMYLIEAEADCHLGKESAAQNLLVELTKNSGRDPSYSCTKTGDDLLEEVKLYRRIELWGEGFDWFDCKRWKKTIVRRSLANGGSFHAQFAKTIAPEDNNEWVWVIPAKEVDYNSMIKSFE